MRALVLLGLVVGQFYVIHASYDEVADYWYSSDDGIIADYLTPVALYRSRNIDNKTLEVGDHKPIINHSSMRNKNLYKTGRFSQSGSYNADSYKNENQRRQYATPPPSKEDLKLQKLQHKVTEVEIEQCTEGATMELDCNHCLCMGGQLYVCTAKRCLHPNAQGEMMLMSYREAQRDECIEGERIKSFDCNRCWCSGGRIVCTKMGCVDGQPNLDDPRGSCTPGTEVPPPDDCNTCGCTDRGEKYCTLDGCGLRPRLVRDNKLVGCVAQTWYSLYNPNSNCKECFCLDGKMSFCYLKLCINSEDRQGYKPKMQTLSKSIKCLKGQEDEDECTKCKCTFKEEWLCYTKMSVKCRGPSPILSRPAGTQLSGKKPIKKKRVKDRHMDKRVLSHKVKNPKTSKRPRNYDSFSGQVNEPRKPGKYTEEDFAVSGKKPMKKKKKTDLHIDKKVLSHKVKNPKTSKRPRNHDSISGEVNEPRKPGKYTEQDFAGPEEYNEDMPIQSPSQPRKFTRPRRTRARTRTTTPEAYNDEYYGFDKQGLDEQGPDGPSCNPGQYFNQGTKYSCHGCFCTHLREWKCFSSPKACRDPKGCGVGTIEKNTKSLCSACYCGADGDYICAFDQLCAQALDTKISCDSLKCSRRCINDDHYYGVCIGDRCTCI